MGILRRITRDEFENLNPKCSRVHHSRLDSVIQNNEKQPIQKGRFHPPYLGNCPVVEQILFYPSIRLLVVCFSLEVR